MSRRSSRRDFLKSGLAATAVAVTVGPRVILNRDSAWAQTYPDVVVSHGRNPSGITRSAVEAMGGMKRFVKSGNKVVIKANMSFASGQSGAATASRNVPKAVGSRQDEGTNATTAQKSGIKSSGEPHDSSLQEAAPVLNSA
ncbi:MAG: twin-arginine translocation signal domain-containing protein [Desulfomonilaceae bacterium]